MADILRDCGLMVSINSSYEDGDLGGVNSTLILNCLVVNGGKIRTEFVFCVRGSG